MSGDTKAIIGTVVAIGGLVLGQGFYLNARIDDVNVSVNARIDDTNARIDDLNARIDDLQADVRELRALVIDTIERIGPAD
ncbi:MAG: hypothetical protein OXF93_19540 [Acidobacteria bacterium]|nr:hypothetical protein [Acidobacteriota bacterium]